MMKEETKVNDGYKLARCCSPQPPERIAGYFSHNNLIVVHRSDCPNLLKVEPERLLSLSWDEISKREKGEPEEDYLKLDLLDFGILRHHQEMGIDYSLVVAESLKVDLQQMFERHRKLRNMKLLRRVERVMIRYRKNIVKNKWIKHRNHTYYEITPKGRRYLEHFVSQHDKPE
jgi:hypothetical protein